MSKSYRPVRASLAEPLESRTLPSVPAGFSETLVASGLTSPTTMARAGRPGVYRRAGRAGAGRQERRPLEHALRLAAGCERRRARAHRDRLRPFVRHQRLRLPPLDRERLARAAPGGQPGHGQHSNRDVAVSSSRVDLLELPAISSAFHLGGPLQFGPDGKLYVAVGETNNPPYAQSLNAPFGKILRINRDGSIPTDNPFYAQTSGKNRAIWARGLRNPYGLAFQPGTARMFINDVGPGQLEPPTNPW